MSSSRLVVAVVILTLFAATPAFARHAEVVRESSEGAGSPGQYTCLSGLPCDDFATNIAYSQGVKSPLAGRLILDSMIWTGGALHNNVLYTGGPHPHFSGTDRETGGTLPPIVVPGHLSFRAWYGYWDDLNGDGVINQNVISSPDPVTPAFPLASVKGYGEGNEFAAAEESDLRHVGGRLGDLRAFVSPGSRPTISETRGPTESEPDFVYARAGSYPDRLYRSFTSVAALDGSVLERWTVESVSEVILIPDEQSNRPYRTSEYSRIDIDHYVAVVPPPIEQLYRDTAAPYVHLVASPAPGSCPNDCNFPPAPMDEAGPVVATAYARYEREVDPALASDPRRASAAAGKLDQFKEAYHAWTDLLPSMTLGAGSIAPLRKVYPLPGKSEDGGITVLPGVLLSFEIWTGVWKDISDDGYIGHVDASDPYASGNRPIADRYGDTAGEFIPWDSRSPTGQTVPSVTIVPDGSWGDAGVYVFATAGVPYQGPCVILLPTGNCVLAEYLREEHILRGTETYRLPMTRVNTESGHFTAGQYLWFPEGTRPTGFTACMDKHHVTFEAAGVLIPEEVWDCDYVGRPA